MPVGDGTNRGRGAAGAREAGSGRAAEEEATADGACREADGRADVAGAAEAGLTSRAGSAASRDS